MKTVKQKTISHIRNKFRFDKKFRFIMAGLIIFAGIICNSCDPDDDTTDGTSGATSLNRSTPKNYQINTVPILHKTNPHLSIRKDLLSYFKCTHPDVRKAAVPPLYQSREGDAPSGAGGESV